MAGLLRKLGGLGPETEPLARSLIVRLVVANVAAGVALLAYLMLLSRLPTGLTWHEQLGITALSFAVLGVVFIGLAVRRAREMFVPEWQWLDRGRPPTDDERAAILAQPLQFARLPLRYWAAAAVFAAISTSFGGDGSIGIGLTNAIGTLQGGLVASTMTFLLAEDSLRPYAARALATADALPARRPTVGIRPRLLLAWIVGSGIPLLGIVLTPIVATPGHELPVAVPMVYLAVVGLVAGYLLTTATAHWIADPLEQTRVALAEVGVGNLDVAIVVDDSGELGQLQQGFNAMVAGLRERDRVTDLFGRHVGTEVAEISIEHGAELGGVVRPVSAFFVDVIGSTRLARERPANEVISILNDFFAVVVLCITAEGGWINKFEGDGALCVFGAPTVYDDHQVRALRAARALRCELDRFVQSHHGVDAGIGISSGDAVVGNIGTEQRLEYTIIGPPVNEAARLSEAAKLREIKVLAAATTVQQAGDESESWSDAGTLDLRGLEPGFAVCEPRL